MVNYVANVELVVVVVVTAVFVVVVGHRDGGLSGGLCPVVLVLIVVMVMVMVVVVMVVVITVMGSGVHGCGGDSQRRVEVVILEVVVLVGLVLVREVVGKMVLVVVLV